MLVMMESRGVIDDEEREVLMVMKRGGVSDDGEGRC